MKKTSASIFVYLLVGFFAFSHLGAQQVLGPVQLDVPEFEKDKTGQLKIFDYNLKLNAFTHKNLSLKDIKNQNTLIFYFSAKCGHCQAAFPLIQEASETLATKKVKTIAIAVAMNTEPDIAKFITELKGTIPFFHDKDRQFSRLYGTGNVPLVVLVNKQGKIIQFKHFNKKETLDQVHFAFSDKAKFPD